MSPRTTCRLGSELVAGWLKHIVRARSTRSGWLCAWLCAGSLHAATFTPGDPLDGTDSNTLRGAVIAANLAGGTNTILLTNSTYHLTLVGAGEDGGFTGDLEVTNGKVAILGLCLTNVTITAAGLSNRVFHVLPGAQLVLSNLCVTGGTAPDGVASGEAGSPGGGIFNGGTLAMSRCVVSGNAGGTGAGGVGYLSVSGAGGNGGGIYNIGTLALNECVIADNSGGASAGGDDYGGASGSGGGIYSLGTATLNDSTISSNFCDVGGAGYGYYGSYGAAGDGGGIWNGGSLTLSNSTVNGNCCGVGGVPGYYLSGPGGNGGGIYSTNELTLSRCTVKNNASAPGGPGGFYPGLNGGDGGGICCFGTATLTTSFITGNSTGAGGAGGAGGTGAPGPSGGVGGSGGGICNSGGLTLEACTISGNFSGAGGLGGHADAGIYYGGDGGPGGAGGAGGGICNGGSLTLRNSTLSGNTTGPGGGGGSGIGIGYGGTGGNGGEGGGLCNHGVLTLQACTIAINRNGSGGSGGGSYTIPGSGGGGGTGAGVFNADAGSTVSLQDSLIALNSTGAGGAGGTQINGSRIGSVGAEAQGPDVAGAFISQGHNLVGRGDGGLGLTNGSNGDLVGTSASPLDPRLGPLQCNGGFTPTHALLAGSPALDQGISCGLATDQCGRPRVHDYGSIPNAVGGDGSDIGAFEADAPLLSIRRLASRAVYSWDANGPACVLECNTNLVLPSDWLSATGTPAIVNGQYYLTNTAASGNNFFRLRSN
jgi:hypothetical protein